MPDQLAILGAGRAGCAIHHQLTVAGRAPGLLWTRSEATAMAARAEGFDVTASPELPDLTGKSLILLAVSDGAVASLAAELNSARAVPAEAIVAHLSGALDLAPLAPLAGAGYAIGSLHPLVSIATRRTSLKSAAAAVAASSAEADRVLSELAKELGLFVIRPQGDRARYHAAASIVGNFPQALLAAATLLFEAVGITADEARRALGPLLEGAAHNAALLGPAAGLTGPIVRGDLEVVRRHLAAIDTLPSPEIERLYRAAAQLALELARARGAPNTAAIEVLLRGR